MNKNFKVTKDGFVWRIVNNISPEVAIAIWEAEFEPLYILHDDDSESEVESLEELTTAMENDAVIGIEVGYLKELNDFFESK